MRITINENFNSLVEFINSYESKVQYKELIDFAITNHMFKDMYECWHILVKLIDEHNSQVI